MRKIVQILVNEKCLVALCEDGTLWTLPDSMPTTWFKLPAIPGDEEYANQMQGWANHLKEMYAS